MPSGKIHKKSTGMKKMKKKTTLNVVQDYEETMGRFQQEMWEDYEWEKTIGLEQEQEEKEQKGRRSGEQEQEELEKQMKEHLKQNEDMNFRDDYAEQRERDLLKESGELKVFWSGDEVFPMEVVNEKYIY